MQLMGDRTDDIEAFKRGDEEGVLNPEVIRRASQTSRSRWPTSTCRRDASVTGS